MTDVTMIATRYIELWNERDPQRRRDLLAANWTRDARYVDPLMAGTGRDETHLLIVATMTASTR